MKWQRINKKKTNFNKYDKKVVDILKIGRIH